MSQKLLFLIVLIGFLGFSSAVTYPVLEFNDVGKIPYCLNQLGHRCLVCGPIKDSNDTKAVIPTALNVLENACLPSQNGCAQFNDMKGQVCSGECFCGFNLDYKKNCIKKVIDNCKQLDKNGTKCAECIGPKTDYNYGGGLNDYGASYDQTKCIDNMANGRSNCIRYREGDQDCGNCRNEYFLTQQFNCILPKSGITINPNCLFISKDGTQCETCKNGYSLDINSVCVDLGLQKLADKNCVRYGTQPDGITTDYSLCLQCSPGRFIQADGLCSENLKDNTGSTISLLTGSFIVTPASSIPPPNCALAVPNYYPLDSTDDQKVVWLCSLYKDDPLVQQFYAIAPTPAQLVNTKYFCNDWDDTAMNCKSSAACQNGYPFNTVTNQCDQSDCAPVNCLQFEGGRWCNICQKGYVLYEGVCLMKPSTVTENCVEWDPITFECTKCDDQKYLEDGTKQCLPLPEIIGCSKYLNDKCSECVENRTLSADGTTCDWNLPVENGGVYGCREFVSDGICKSCFTYFFLSEDKKKCSFLYPKGDQCADKDTKGNCILCNDITYSIYVDLFGVRSCIKLTDNYCDTTFDKCHCLACKPGFTQDANGNCNMKDPSNAAINLNPNVVIPGCIKFKSSTQCQRCQFPDYLITDDKKCYDLRVSRSSTMIDTTSINAFNIYREPCSKAKNIHECTQCQLGATGLMQFDSSNVPAQGYARSFCIYNVGDSPIKIQKSYLVNSDSGTYDIVGIQYCKKYVLNDKTALVCDVCYDGKTKSSDGKECLDQAEKAAALNCKTYSSSTGCSACKFNYFLKTDKTCINPDKIGCSSIDPASGACNGCMKGWTFDSISVSPVIPCIRDISADKVNMCVGGSEGSCMVKKIQIIQDPAGAANTPKIQVLECSQGGVYLAAEQRCIVDTSVQQNCEVVNKYAGFCEKCQSGYFLLIYDKTYGHAQDRMNRQVCVPEVKDCIQYGENYDYRCNKCSNSAEGQPQQPDGSGLNCITPENQNPFCLSYAAGDFTKCTMCKANTGELANNCQPPIENCEKYDRLSQKCLTCMSSFVLSAAGLCIENLVKNCLTPFDSTLCAVCKDGYTIIPFKNNKVSRAFGLCVVQQIEGCLIANEDHTKCFRCKEKNYAIVDGICFKNDGSDVFPFYCISYGYNSTSRSPYCSECDRGFGITQNNTRCLINSGACVESLERDCYQYDLLESFQTINKCRSFNRPGISAMQSLMAIYLLALLVTF